MVKFLVVKFCGGEVFGEVSGEVSGEPSGEVLFALLVKFQVTNLVEKHREEDEDLDDISLRSTRSHWSTLFKTFSYLVGKLN